MPPKKNQIPKIAGNVPPIILVFFMLVLTGNSVFSQSPDNTPIIGTWNGTYSFLNSNYPSSLKLREHNGEIDGDIFSLGKDSSNFVHYELTGKLNSKTQQLNLTATKLIKSRGQGCMSNLELKLIESPNFQLLDGKWKSSRIRGGCLPGVHGKISLVKATNPINAETDSELKEEKDEEADKLVTKLKERQYQALIIGIDKYDDLRLQSLNNTISDGKRLEEVLVNHYSFDRENIIRISNPNRSEILDAFEVLSSRLTNKDNLLIFYAGHGMWKEKLEQGYWIPSDGKLDSKTNWISNSTIRDYIKGFKCKHTLLIVDACFSGSIIMKHRGIGKSLLSMYNLPSRKAITSGVLEYVPDESVFLDYLIKGLEENQAALLSAGQLFYEMKVAVIQNSPLNQVPQYGPINQSGDEGGEFIFLRKL